MTIQLSSEKSVLGEIESIFQIYHMMNGVQVPRFQFQYGPHKKYIFIRWADHFPAVWEVLGTIDHTHRFILSPLGHRLYTILQQGHSHSEIALFHKYTSTQS